MGGDDFRLTRRAGDFPSIFLPSAIQSIRPYLRNVYVEIHVPIGRGPYCEARYDIVDAANEDHVLEVVKKKYGKGAKVRFSMPVDVRGLILALKRADEDIKQARFERGIFELPGVGWGMDSISLGKPATQTGNNKT